jgi:spore coat polysaccharide biosynthesis predicted glycosyltransferase SpsG
MKMIIGRAGEGKTSRVVELAAEIAATNTEVTIFTFGENTAGIMHRVSEYVKKQDLEVDNESINAVFVYGKSKEQFLDMVKESESKIVFIDDVLPGIVKSGSASRSMYELFDNLGAIEKKKRIGIFATVTRHPMNVNEGIRVVDYVKQTEKV